MNFKKWFSKNKQEGREWGFLVLAFATLLIGIATVIIGCSTLDLQKETTATLKSNIILNSVDNHFFSPYQVSSINHMVNGTYWMSEGYLGFGITNLGQKHTNYMNFYVKDPEKVYYFENAQIKDLQSLDNTFIQIAFWSKNCSQIYADAQFGNQSWEIPARQCEKVSENLTTGIKTFLLRVQCPGCGFDEDSRCYTFKTCVYSSNVSICGKNKDYYNLQETGCPENWFE